MKTWIFDFLYFKCIYVFIFSVSKQRKYIFRLNELYEEHALPYMVYFHSSFLKNTALAECWDILGLRVKVQESHTQHGEKSVTVTLARLEKCPGKDSSTHICCDQEQEEVKFHPALSSSTKEQNCATLASLTISTTQWSRKEW